MTQEKEPQKEDLIQQVIDFMRSMMEPPYYLDEDDFLAADAGAAGGGTSGYGSLALDEVARRQHNKMKKNWWTPFALNIEHLLSYTPGLEAQEKQVLRAEKMEILARIMHGMYHGDKRVKRADVEALEDVGRRVIALVEVARRTASAE